jgi:periplasmic mercuric ion binding protein
MRKFLIPSIFASFIAAMPALAEQQQISIGVSKMTCPTCSFTVASSMRGVPTVEVLEFQESDTFGEGVFTVAYDDQSADPAMIVGAVMANGYPAEVLLAEES